MESDQDCYGNMGGYCTPMDVAEIIRLKDPITGKLLEFTDDTDPTFESVCRRIQARSDAFDNAIHDSWQVKRVENLIFDRGQEWAWVNSRFIGPPIQSGGWESPLSANICEWSPELGDKLERRTVSNGWVDISDEIDKTFWFDYQGGMFYCTRSMPEVRNAFRITYRHGKTTPVPSDIRDAVAGMVGVWVMGTDFYNSVIGQGGGLPNKDSAIKRFEDEYKAVVSNRMSSIIAISLLP